MQHVVKLPWLARAVVAPVGLSVDPAASGEGHLVQRRGYYTGLSGKGVKKATACLLKAMEPE